LPQKGGQDATPKKLPETDAIFEHLKEVNARADAQEGSLRLSMDTKAVVKVGPFARGGKSRILTKAADHDFKAQDTVTPVGIFLPASDELFLYGVTSKVTSDCLVDRLIQWWESVKERFAQIKKLVINLDNGPENQSHRTQFMQRLLDFTQTYQVSIHLAYYPPYHSKYNPVERCWGILEHHWNGALLDSVHAVIQYAETMTWKGKHPVVEVVTTTYQTGVKLAKEAMQTVETHLQRWPTLEKWFVDISSQPTGKRAPDPTLPKRPRGRPRTRPLPDLTLPKRPRGRPRTSLLA
jgi:transposase